MIRLQASDDDLRAKLDAAPPFERTNGRADANSGESGPAQRILDLEKWRAPTAYGGDPPPLRWLIEGFAPLAVPVLIAAEGGLGKSMILLDLAWLISSGKGAIVEIEIFGGKVRAEGAAVIIAGEDGADTVHRRLGARERPDHLYIVPLPDAGGPLPLVRQTREGLAATHEFHLLRKQLLAIPNLKLVVIDPLQAFVHADINADPAAAQYTFGLLAQLARETGATVMVAHHMRKPSGTDSIKTAGDARNAIRGTTGIVDAVRAVCAMWPAYDDDRQQILKLLGSNERFDDASRCPIVLGAVVKANERATQGLQTYRRTKNGQLIDVSRAYCRALASDLPGLGVQEEALDQIVEVVKTRAKKGKPFSRTGQSEIFSRKNELPEQLQHLSRAKLRKIVDHLLVDGRLVQAMATGSHAVKWLDVPGGPFAQGEGEFEHGAAGHEPE
jgi:hypothetical protein